MKETELRLISELMKNSRRTDRELAKTMHVSQPTVSRTRHKLEKQDFIKQYTMIPNFTKLGYTLLAVTLVKLKESLTAEQTEKARDEARRSMMENHNEIIMLERGLGLGYNGVFLSFHKDYSSFLDLKKWLESFEFLKITATDSFIVDLQDSVRYRSLTLSTLAEHVLTMNEGK